MIWFDFVFCLFKKKIFELVVPAEPGAAALTGVALELLTAVCWFWAGWAGWAVCSCFDSAAALAIIAAARGLDFLFDPPKPDNALDIKAVLLGVVVVVVTVAGVVEVAADVAVKEKTYWYKKG